MDYLPILAVLKSDKILTRLIRYTMSHSVQSIVRWSSLFWHNVDRFSSLTSFTLEKRYVIQILRVKSHKFLGSQLPSPSSCRYIQSGHWHQSSRSLSYLCPKTTYQGDIQSRDIPDSSVAAFLNSSNRSRNECRDVDNDFKRMTAEYIAKFACCSMSTCRGWVFRTSELLYHIFFRQPWCWLAFANTIP